MLLEVFVPRTTSSIRHTFHWFVLLLITGLAITCRSQEIRSTYADLKIPGQWQSGQKFAAAHFGSDIYYDAGTGTVVQISQQPGMQKVGELAKFFSSSSTSSKDAAGVMCVAAFPLPFAYTEKASKDLAKGTKPPKMWDMKGGEGNPLWFYASQLFDTYQMHDSSGSSEVTESFLPVHVTKAEQRAVTGGDALLFEVESDKPASEAALKRFQMPAAYKDQKIRFGWVQFAPGGIASGQGVLSVSFATAVNTKLNIEEVVNQVSAAKIKPL
jgi:hypothetical protein